MFTRIIFFACWDKIKTMRTRCDTGSIWSYGYSGAMENRVEEDGIFTVTSLHFESRLVAKQSW